MIELDIDPDALKLPKGLTIAIKNDLKFITAQALNSTMSGSKFMAGTRERNVRTNLEKNSKGFLDRPKASVQKGWFLNEKANKNSLVAGLNFKDKPFNRYRYIAPHISGAKRKQKSFEKLLINHPLASKGISPTAQLVPNKDNFQSPLRIDKFGSPSKSSIDYIYKNITSTKRSSHRSSLTAKKVSIATKGGKSDPTFLVGKPRHGNRPAGIWWRRNDNQKLWLIFKAVEQTDYKPIYLAERTMNTTIKRLWKKNFETSYKKELPHFF